METELSRQSYVMTEDGVTYSLKYFLETGEDSENHREYGVMIEEELPEHVVAEIRGVSQDKFFTLGLIDMLASGFVFPQSLSETIESYMEGVAV